MFPLLETIRIENGEMMNLSYHEDRITRSLAALYGYRKLDQINNLLKLSSNRISGIYKCSLVYSNTDFKASLQPYKKRTIDRLLILEKPDIQYEFKYADRSVFMNIIPEDENSTELIFSKSGLLTDTRYTNIALDKNGTWITPLKPLLEGTQRAQLIDRGIIFPGSIMREELKLYSSIRLFNAMMPWEDSIELDITQISDYD